MLVEVPGGGARLYVRRFGRKGPPILMIHGAVENGRIFYSERGDRGLAPWLASQGFDVFAADLRGRGRSTPRLGRGVDHRQTDSIVGDLPALSAAIALATGAQPQHWIAHSWGGVLAQSCLARHPELARGVASVTCFGTKRSVAVLNAPKLIGIDLMWNGVGRLAATACGYLPGRALRLGSDDEPLTWYRDCVRWVSPRHPWVDIADGFDYAAAARRTPLPRTLHLAGACDRFLGHPRDVARFVEECSQSPAATMRLLGKEAGRRHDYGHVDMLTHPDAPADHFPLVAAWLGGMMPG